MHPLIAEHSIGVFGGGDFFETKQTFRCTAFERFAILFSTEF